MDRNMGKFERVQKLISNAGHCSRRRAEQLIKEGRVTVNEQVIPIGTKASLKDRIMVDNLPVEKTEGKVYIAMNKPSGYTTTLSDPYEKKTIASLLPVQERVYPIGRLDKNSRGLLLLTNDGDFANLIMHPSHGVEKTYMVTLDKPYDTRLTETVARGIRLRDGLVKARIMKKDKKIVAIILHEGRKHIVKRLFMKLGYYVRDLVRVGIGDVKLDLKPGKSRMLTRDEMEALRKSAVLSRNSSSTGTHGTRQTQRGTRK